MKNTLFLSISLLLGAATQAQTTVFSEDFQTGIGPQWTIMIEDTFVVDSSVIEFETGWIALPDPDNLTDTVAGATSFFTTPGQANRWLISPAITLGAYGNILSWDARAYDPSFPDGYTIWISNTDNNISSFTDSLITIYQEYEEWTTRSVNLSDSGYNNQTVYLAFVINSYDKFKLFMDDINVVIEDPVGIAEQSVVDFGLYPNPTSNIINISSQSEVKSVRIIDALGNVAKTVKGNITSLNIESLNSGMYWLELTTTDNEVGRKRFVKQ